MRIKLFEYNEKIIFYRVFENFTNTTINLNDEKEMFEEKMEKNFLHGMTTLVYFMVFDFSKFACFFAPRIKNRDLLDT